MEVEVLEVQEERQVDISGCAAIVTGSSSVTGIGAMTARLLAERGCNVVINYNENEAGARETASLCEAHGVEALVCQANVAEDADCRRMVAAAVAKWGVGTAPWRRVTGGRGGMTCWPPGARVGRRGGLANGWARRYSPGRLSWNWPR